MKKISLVACFYAASLVAGRADVTLSPLFSEHAVLQRSDVVPVWGKAAPREAVSVTLDKATASTTASEDGRWKVLLNLTGEPPGPFALVVKGTNTLTVGDVVVGEVWICGGQSNMQFPLTQAANSKAEIAASANPLLRHFKVKETASATPLDSFSIQGKWEVADPKTSGQFSGTGYFFGRDLQAALKVPVGLLNASWGGTCVEAWTSAEGFNPDPELKAGAQQADDQRLAYDMYLKETPAWQKQYGREDHPTVDPQTFAAPGIDTADWKPITLPGTFAEAGLPDAGAVWVRRTVTLPTNVGNALDLFAGDVRDYDQVYWDGKLVGSGNIASLMRHYSHRGDGEVTPGEHVVAIRVFQPAGGGGIAKTDTRFRVNGVQLAGPWLAKVEYALPPPDAAAKAALLPRPPLPLDFQNVASYDYNGMIAPIIPYAMRGVVWYQGEQNSGHGYQYRSAFPLVIKDWRTRWGRGSFPFYYCQIASYNGHDSVPGRSIEAELREAQTMTLAVPNTGQAILIDIGEDANIHPADKQDVGDRLCRIALANTYGRKDVVFSGPVYEKMAVEGNQVRLHFLHAEGGLKAKMLPAVYQPISADPKTVPLKRESPNSELEGFAICGDDKQWKWADAKIAGADVLVSSPAVPRPVAVRYAWSNYPYCNLYNGAGLPAGPFRTDDYPLLSQKARYP